jgi:hypothetical protein
MSLYHKEAWENPSYQDTNLEQLRQIVTGEVLDNRHKHAELLED